MYRIESMTMYSMLRVLEYCYAITAADLSCVEFREGWGNLPYCLLFCFADRPETYLLRVRRRSEVDPAGFFFSDIVLDSHGRFAEVQFDWRYVNQSFIKDYAQVAEIVPEVN